jgi:glycosyltransferase involved in cell wall biosynthesis
VRILLASHRYYPSAGGTEQHVRHLAEGLAVRGHSVTVVTAREPGLSGDEEIAGVRVHRIPLRRVGGVRMPMGYHRFLRSQNPDLFHLQGNRIWCADFYFPLARLYRWPQLLTGHGFYQWELHPGRVDRWYFSRYFPWAVGGFDRYVTLTPHERALLRGWGVPERRLAYIPHGIDPAEFVRPPPGVPELRASWKIRTPLIAVYAGGFFENKRVDRLVQALAPVRERWGLVALGADVPGSPYDRAYCERLAQRLGVEFEAIGSVTRLDTIRAIFASDAVVLGSEYEGFGLLPVEAMAAGKPFVAFDAGAAPELARTGGGVAVTTIPAMSEALLELDDPGRRATVGRLGRAGLTEFSSDVMVGRYVELYQTVLRERGHGHVPGATD